MPDIKKFTGFIAPDGSTHSSLKSATDHTRDLKIKAALAGLALSFDSHCAGITVTVDGDSVVCANTIADYLFANKVRIEAAYNPEVTTRKKRTPSVAGPVRVKKVKADLSVSSAVQGDGSDGVSAHPGVLNLDADE